MFIIFKVLQSGVSHWLRIQSSTTETHSYSAIRVSVEECTGSNKYNTINGAPNELPMIVLLCALNILRHAEGMELIAS